MSNRVVLAIMVLVVGTIAGHAATLSPEDASSHINESATVCGPVASATYAAQAPMAPTFLDLGRPYPNQIFTAVIFGSDRPKFGTEDFQKDQRLTPEPIIKARQGANEADCVDRTEANCRRAQLNAQWCLAWMHS